MNRSPSAISEESTALMRSIIKRIATGPELSKDISREEARQGMLLVLNGEVDPVQAAVFLIALRMKRETDDEMKGILEALLANTQTVTAPVAEVLDLADPYDGFARTLPAAPFLAALLAACGVAAVSHGVESMGPKYGVTHRQVLSAAGVPVDLSPDEAAARLGEPGIGWAYLDQKAFCPKLYALASLRALIVKRPCITAAEVLLGPVRGRNKTHLVTGYVHKPYSRIYAMLARCAGFDSALIVRGVEGGVIPSLRQAGKAYCYHDKGPEQALEFGPEELGIDQLLLAAPLPAGVARGVETGGDFAGSFDKAAIARAAAQAGEAALGGQPGATRDSLICGAALCLRHLGRFDTLNAAAAAVRQVLDSGKALENLRRAR
jgi:anthranilate phosphoribosyltransferase